MQHHLRLGTRGSLLALAQARMMEAELVRQGYPVTVEIIKTTGDRVTDRPLGMVGVKGMFVKELEEALLEHRIDLAVHSMKDLPGEMPDGLTLGAVPPREDPRDVLISPRAHHVHALPDGAVIGSSSPRRRAQLLALRPDFNVVDLRGNLDTRLRKLDEGQYDAICLAAAGLHRLGWRERISAYIDADMVVPAVGQGALALQCRADDADTLAALAPLNDPETWLAILAERSLLAALGGGCAVPLGAHATVTDNVVTLHAVLCSPDGATLLRETGQGVDPEYLGRSIAERMVRHGGQELLDTAHAVARDETNGEKFAH